MLSTVQKQQWNKQALYYNQTMTRFILTIYANFTLIRAYSEAINIENTNAVANLYPKYYSMCVAYAVYL